MDTYLFITEGEERRGRGGEGGGGGGGGGGEGGEQCRFFCRREEKCIERTRVRRRQELLCCWEVDFKMR
jgi:hypothetical protein